MHHALHYTADNAVLAFSGNIEPERTRCTSPSATSARCPAASASRRCAPDPSQRAPRLDIVDNVSSQTELRVCFRALAETDPLRPGARRADAHHRRRDVDAALPPPLRLARLCYDVSAGYDGYEDDGVVDVAAGVQHKRVALVTREILAMFEELAVDGPTPEELEKVRRRVAWDTRAMADSAEEAAAFYASGALFDRPSTPRAACRTARRVSGPPRSARRRVPSRVPSA